MLSCTQHTLNILMILGKGTQLEEIERRKEGKCKNVDYYNCF